MTNIPDPADYIAIDVSKATLQAQDDQRSFTLDNDSKGHLKTRQNPLGRPRRHRPLQPRPVLRQALDHRPSRQGSPVPLHGCSAVINFPH
jgi:hypothetical protein